MTEDQLRHRLLSLLHISSLQAIEISISYGMEAEEILTKKGEEEKLTSAERIAYQFNLSQRNMYSILATILFQFETNKLILQDINWQAEKMPTDAG